MPIPFSYSLRNIAVRKSASAMAVGGIALVVIVFVALFALAQGFRKAVATSGRPDNLIVIRKGADAEMGSQIFRENGVIISELPQVARDESGQPLASLESVILLARPKVEGAGDTNISVRGTGDLGRRVRGGVRLMEGRWFAEGSNEACIGVGLARRMEGFGLGQSVRAGRQEWRIVGVFEADGSSLESEMWIDAPVLQSVFARGNIYQSLLFRVSGDPELARLEVEKVLAFDPRLRAHQVQTEKAYYEKQAKLMAGVISTLGGILTFVMAIGAVVGAMNTMYAAVSQRKREIGCLLAMGFTPFSIWFAFITESVLLASVGAAIGCGASLALDGLRTGTINWMTFSETVFEFSVTPEILAKAAVLSLLMGLIGGFLPAVSAARMKVVDALRRV